MKTSFYDLSLLAAPGKVFTPRPTTERLVDKVDSPRAFPLVGSAQLHHCRWRCTVHFNETVESSYPYAFRSRRPRVEVVYLDRDYLVVTPPAR